MITVRSAAIVLLLPATSALLLSPTSTRRAVLRDAAALTLAPFAANAEPTAPRRTTQPRCAEDAREERIADLVTLLSTPAPPPVAASDAARSDSIDALLDALCPLNPTPRPGSTEGFAPLAAGRWRVAFAPHIAKLSALGGVRFDPIIYALRPDGSIESNVRYTWLGGLSGWLSTRGRYGSRDEDQVSYVEWEDAWWNPGADAPSADPADGAFAPLVSAMGTAGFVSAAANFPVKYLDRDLCVFVFPLSGTRILAVREGGALDVWRQSSAPSAVSV